MSGRLLRRRQIGLMFQSFQLLDTLTAEENVALPLAIGGCAADEARQRAARLLGSVGLAHRRQHRPHELSGGEQQRVAIARALVIEPLLLLADEPTGNLDSVQGEKIMTLLRQLVDERGQTLFMVTHDANHAALADRIVYLRDGRIVEERAGEYTARRSDATPRPLPSSLTAGVKCVEWSVAPPPCPFSAVAFVAPCSGDALEHAPGPRGRHEPLDLQRPRDPAPARPNAADASRHLAGAGHRRRHAADHPHGRSGLSRTCSRASPGGPRWR